MESQKTRLVIGLGNPGPEYDKTRHNIGKRVVEVLRSYGEHPLGVRFFFTDGYMNTSGSEVALYARKNGIRPEQLLVVYDDFEIPLGRLRVRPEGSHGGHNGMKSILENLGTASIPRVRIGIGPVPDGVDPADFVLKRFSPAEEKQLETVMETARTAIEDCISEGVESAMNKYNGLSL